MDLQNFVRKYVWNDEKTPSLTPVGRLTQRQARESGICPVREDLYSQCFDELIRQVTLASMKPETEGEMWHI